MYPLFPAPQPGPLYTHFTQKQVTLVTLIMDLLLVMYQGMGGRLKLVTVDHVTWYIQVVDP